VKKISDTKEQLELLEDAKVEAHVKIYSRI
jgi:hypothetical protein